MDDNSANPSIVCIITARGGSKSIPRKNVLPLGGKPVIAWSIEAALQSPSVSRVIVSTDDEEIAEVSRDWGAEVPFMRPAELAGDDTPHLAVMFHAIRWLESDQGTLPEFILLLQPTSPLRTSEDIEAAVRIAVEQNADSVLGVTELASHPYQARRTADDGTLTEFIANSPAPGTSKTRRQEFPTAYRINGSIYLTRTEVLRDQHTFEPPRTFPYVLPSHRSWELDEPWELYVANLIMENRDGSSYH